MTKLPLPFAMNQRIHSFFSGSSLFILKEQAEMQYQAPPDSEQHAAASPRAPRSFFPHQRRPPSSAPARLPGSSSSLAACEAGDLRQGVAAAEIGGNAHGIGRVMVQRWDGHLVCASLRDDESMTRFAARSHGTSVLGFKLIEEMKNASENWNHWMVVLF
jgi:hypothetical protein